MNACEDQSEPLGEHIDTLTAIGRGAVLGIVSAADEVLATKQLAERQTQALNKVRELHRPVEYYEYDDTNGVFKTDADGERILMGRVCRECSTDEFLEILGDCEIEDSTRYEGEVAYPCETIRALDEAGA